MLCTYNFCPVLIIGRLHCTNAKLQPCLASRYCINNLTRYPKCLATALQSPVSICDLLQHTVHAEPYFFMNGLLGTWPRWSHMTSTQDTLPTCYLLDAVQPFLRYRGCQTKTVEVTSKSIHSWVGCAAQQAQKTSVYCCLMICILRQHNM